jgi:hypothetical protein
MVQYMDMVDRVVVAMEKVVVKVMVVVMVMVMVVVRVVRVMRVMVVTVMVVVVIVRVVVMDMKNMRNYTQDKMKLLNTQMSIAYYMAHQTNYTSFLNYKLTIVNDFVLHYFLIIDDLSENIK